MDGQNPLKDTKREVFCQEYLTDLNATQAAIRAGYSKKTAKQQGSRLLSYDDVAARITHLAADRVNRLRISADDLLIRAETILKADPRELTEHRIGACRYCWGIDHEYQWKTKREFREVLARATAKLPRKPTVAQRDALPTEEGGYGYKVTRDPNPECPECGGLGSPFVQFADTRKLSPEAAILFEGVKETKDGIEIKMASKDRAFDTLAKHHKIAVETHEHTGKDGKPIEHDVKVKARVVLVPPKAMAPSETRPIPKEDGAT
ncbi:MAG: terminase small subunit [Proteobacteria bacterium]|nr:terminase small subunit [Pseudomonadota bacterium]